MEPLFFRSISGWRRWLKENHGSEDEALILFYKKHLNRGLSYEEVLEEALCWGWIDGRLNRIDDEKHVIRFSPRRKNSIWSDANKLRVRKLIAEGRMMSAGRKVLPLSLEPEGRSFSVPDDLSRVLESNLKAKSFFDSLTANQRWMYVGWLLDAKRQETRKRRLEQLLRRLLERKKPGMT